VHKNMKKWWRVTRHNRLEDHSDALLAGGNWNNGASSGSRYRNSTNARTNANNNIGGRFASDTGTGQTPGWIFWPCLWFPVAKHKTEVAGS